MVDALYTRLPDELRALVRDYTHVRHPYEESNAEIYILSCGSNPRLYLKIREDKTQRLEAEYLMLKWIDQRVPTPEPLYYNRLDSTEFLLTTEVAGTPTYQVDPSEREFAVVILAETLRRIHRVNPAGCPVDNRITNRVENLVSNDVDVSSLGDWKPEEVPCFTHGDYCLPNIIVKEGVLSGVIDWDYAGIADPYADLVSCLWSIRYNYKEETVELVQLFLETYGVVPDPVKLDYYQRLNELIP